MRRLVVSVLVGFGLVVIGSGAASAEPVPGASAAQAVAGKKICKVTDERLDELSGMVATDDGFVVVNDGSPLASHKRVFFLDAKCKVVDEVAFPGDPRDTEDLILSPDGETLWIADIGDNNKQRGTIALWSMPSDGSKKPKIHRLSYPDGKHDAEALLLNGDGTPIIVTKEVGEPAELYTPAAPLKTDNTAGVPMKKAGQVTVPPSETSSNSLARVLRGSIDGGAVALGGSKVVLRTYTDALEWDVTDGDVLAALKGAPRVTPLPDEPLGEAIAYSPDGKYFYTVSDMQGRPEDGENFVLRYTPAAKASTNKAAATGGKAGDAGTSWFTDLTINDITYLVGAVGVLGAILVGAGIFGIVRARKRPLAQPAVKSDGPILVDPETELMTVGGAAAGRGEYGSGRPGTGKPVYGAKAAAPPGKGSGVYGGNRPGPGGQPARPGAVGQPPRPGQGGQPARPGQGGQPGRPGQGGQPARPGQGGQPARPGQGGQPGRPGQGGQPARPAQGQPGRPGQGGQPARPAPGGGQPVRRPGGGQAQPTGRPPQGGQPGARPGQGGGGGVYGAPPANPPQGPQRGGPGPRQSGFSGGRPDQMNSSRGRDFENPGYGRYS